MNAKLHSTGSEPECVRVASYVYVFTAVRKMSKMLRKKYLRGSEKRKKMKNSNKSVEPA
jgi:hypothetical protein